ncbi:MAG: NAD(P)-dependent oxidoreductase, partial [Ramlibacter sp.]
MRKGHWHVNTYRGESREIAGMTVGYVGFGRIGQAVAARLASFGARAIYHDLTEAPAGTNAERVQHLGELLARADIVSLHMPLMPSTRHIINAKALMHMKPGAILINASRGGLVDEAALVEVLRNGHLAGAGLDCFETEPVEVDHPLFSLYNVVLTPHTAAATGDALKTKMAALFDNIAGWTSTGTLRNEVKLERNPIYAAP